MYLIELKIMRKVVTTSILSLLTILHYLCVYILGEVGAKVSVSTLGMLKVNGSLMVVVFN